MKRSMHVNWFTRKLGPIRWYRGRVSYSLLSEPVGNRIVLVLLERARTQAN